MIDLTNASVVIALSREIGTSHIAKRFSRDSMPVHAFMLVAGRKTTGSSGPTFPVESDLVMTSSAGAEISGWSGTRFCWQDISAIDIAESSVINLFIVVQCYWIVKVPS